MRLKHHAIGHRLELSQLAPPWHEKEKAKVKQGSDLGDEGANIGWRFDAKYAKTTKKRTKTPYRYLCHVGR